MKSYVLSSLKALEWLLPDKKGPCACYQGRWGQHLRGASVLLMHWQVSSNCARTLELYCTYQVITASSCGRRWLRCADLACVAADGSGPSAASNNPEHNRVAAHSYVL